MFLAVYDGETRELSYANAGHLPPIVIRANGGVERLSITGTVIGLFESMAWEEKTVQLAPGDLVVAFSDGVTEPENEFGEYGEDRLIALVRENRHRALEEIARLTVEAVQQWIGTNEQPDDVTVVLARATA
jgi:sigma-B regulation protein RsbU (phosphoserine phosphatase)